MTQISEISVENKQYQSFHQSLMELADIRHTLSLLSWDQEVNMPPKAAAHRARQLGTLSTIYHEKVTSRKLGDLLDSLVENSELSEKQGKNVARFKELRDKSIKFDAEFVAHKAKTLALANQNWKKARESNDYSMFQGSLQEIIHIAREESQILGFEEHPYDPHMDAFEPKMTVKVLDPILKNAKEGLIPLLKAIRSKKQVSNEFLFKSYDKDKQWDLSVDLIKQLGYDLDAGRQDLSAHPFTTKFGPYDVRVTTRIDEHYPAMIIWGSIHEAGHALYEQGLPAADYGLPSGEAISLSIHESQSRLYENNLGRGLAYWKANYSKLQGKFNSNLKDVSLDTFYRGINRVQPSLIRVEADELTYHTHIIIRYEIEKQLVEGKIESKDAPELWNALYKEYLDLDVPDVQKGILQDIHWSTGNFGYFPTYSLGSFYAAQFYAQADKEIPGLEQSVENGNMKPLLKWLRSKIHVYGEIYSAEELCNMVTGKGLDFSYFLEYATKKYGYIYGL